MTGKPREPTTADSTDEPVMSAEHLADIGGEHPPAANEASRRGETAETWQPKATGESLRIVKGDLGTGGYLRLISRKVSDGTASPLDSRNAMWPPSGLVRHGKSKAAGEPYNKVIVKVAKSSNLGHPDVAKDMTASA